jgi:anti-sigma regulatory factor (Ser/Thr protein kinase)
MPSLQILKGPNEGSLEAECRALRAILEANHVFCDHADRLDLQEAITDPLSPAREILGAGFHRLVVLDAEAGRAAGTGAFDLYVFLRHVYERLVLAFDLNLPPAAYHLENVAQLLKEEPRSLFCFLNVQLLNPLEFRRLRGFTQELHQVLFIRRGRLPPEFDQPADKGAESGESFFARRGGPRRAVRPAVPRIGHFCLAATEHKLYCLNETAKQFLREGVPLTARDLARQPLITLEGKAVVSHDLPMVRAVREANAVDSVFLLDRPEGVAWVLAWHASPFALDDKVFGAFGSLTIPPPEPDWEELAGLSHDLRTPLQTICNLVTVIQSGPLLGPVAEAVDRLRVATERAMSMGQDMVEFCRAPQLGTPRGTRAWLALAPALEKLAAEQVPAAQRKTIRLECDVSAAAGVEVHTDAGRLARLVSNLLVNAIRYTTAGHVQFQASWSDGNLTLSVGDTGIGIASDDPDSIFQPYQRGKASKGDTDSGGSGLSRAVVDRLVSELDFTLEVYSEHGRGSRFDLILPRSQLRQLSATKR